MAAVTEWSLGVGQTAELGARWVEVRHQRLRPKMPSLVKYRHGGRKNGQARAEQAGTLREERWTETGVGT